MGSSDQALICAGTPEIAVTDNRGLAVRALRLNRTASAESLDAQVTRSVFDAAGFAQSATDPRLNAVAGSEAQSEAKPNIRYHYDLDGQVLQTDSADNGETTVFFDIEGRLIWQRDGRGTVTTFSYDALGRASEIHQQMADDSAAALIARTLYGDNDPGMPREHAQAGNLCGAVSKLWDTAGYSETGGISLSGQPQTESRRLLAEAEGDPDWNKAGQLETQSYTTLTKTSASGLVLTQTDALGNRQETTYDVAQRPFQRRLTQAGAQTSHILLQSVRYNADGQVAEETTGNNVVSLYDYEPQTRRLIRMRTLRPDRDSSGKVRTATVQDLRYDYDPVGNIIAISDGTQASSFHDNAAVTAQKLYSYDALYQLIEATGRENAAATSQTTQAPQPVIPILSDPSVLKAYTRRYQYDRGGNLTQTRHTGATSYTRKIVVANSSNRAIMQDGLDSLSPAHVDDGYFDGCGNSLELQPGSQQPLIWNGRNGLAAVTLVARTQSAQSDREAYQYDGSGQRLRKTTLRYKDNGKTCQRDTVIYLPGVEIRRRETLSVGSEATLNEELHLLSGSGGRAGVQILHWTSGRPADMSNDAMRVSLGDQIGSATLELDGDARIITLEEYYPYGGTAVSSAASQSEADYKFRRYSGKERDATGLYYYGLRYYQPWIGRWLNPDPAGTIDGLNLFRMVRNNPITYADADGMVPGRSWPGYRGLVKSRSRWAIAPTIGH